MCLVLRVGVLERPTAPPAPHPEHVGLDVIARALRARRELMAHVCAPSMGVGRGLVP
ncbi:hypothetical protein [Ornithinimicrobium kibberense]|uniref:hypothetical protein n=1 Tax=Ornithinimicrobium kibberense TaxID=282060 RepID=UPI00360FF92C